jgi:hypothetical protein
VVQIKSISERIGEYTKKHPNLTETEIQEKALENAKRSQYKAQNLVYNRFRAIAQQDLAYFITLTYNEKNLHLGSNELAKAWAKEYLDIYYGNDDYGSINERYHHHIFGNFKKTIELATSWKYGAINIQKMRTNEKQLAKYIQRIKAHAFKDNTSKIFKSKRIFAKGSLKKIEQDIKDKKTNALLDKALESVKK